MGKPPDISQLSIAQRMDMLLTPREFLALQHEATEIYNRYDKGNFWYLAYPENELWPVEFQGIDLLELNLLIS